MALHRRNNLKSLLGIILFLLITGLAVAAQGTISGRVTDPNGAIWPDATLILSRDLDKVDIQRTSTDNEGAYHFNNVPFGIFQLRIKVSGIHREFKKRVDLNSKQPFRSDVIISFAPCSDEEASDVPGLTTEDHAKIVRSLVSNLLGNGRSKTVLRKIVFSPQNFSENWLSDEQRSQISVLSRDKIQEITERDGELVYYTISKPEQKGKCVGISLLNNWTVKGQMEDANMAGGEDVYEFRKVDGNWIGLHLFSTIS